MFEFEEANRFLAGELGDVLTVSYEGSISTFYIERRDGDTAQAYIPISRGTYCGGPFDIAKALAHPVCGARFQLRDNEYQVQIDTRHQLYTVSGFGLNHFGWHDYQKIVKKYKRLAKST